MNALPLRQEAQLLAVLKRELQKSERDLVAAENRCKHLSALASVAVSERGKAAERAASLKNTIAVYEGQGANQ